MCKTNRGAEYEEWMYKNNVHSTEMYRYVLMLNHLEKARCNDLFPLRSYPYNPLGSLKRAGCDTSRQGNCSVCVTCCSTRPQCASVLPQRLGRVEIWQGRPQRQPIWVWQFVPTLTERSRADRQMGVCFYYFNQRSASSATDRRPWLGHIAC